jgi:hypothetical protein
MSEDSYRALVIGGIVVFAVLAIPALVVGWKLGRKYADRWNAKHKR